MILWQPGDTLDCLVCGHPIARLDGRRPYGHLVGNATRAFGVANNLARQRLRIGLVVDDDCAADCSPLICSTLRLVPRSSLAAAAAAAESGVMLLCATNLKTLRSFDETPFSVAHPRKWAATCFDFNDGEDLATLTRGIIGACFNNAYHAGQWSNRRFEMPIHVLPYGVDENRYVDDLIHETAHPVAIWIGAIRRPASLLRILRFAAVNPECEVRVVCGMIFDQSCPAGSAGSFDHPLLDHRDGPVPVERFREIAELWSGQTVPPNLRFLGRAPGENAALLGSANVGLGFSRQSGQTHDDSKLLDYLRSGLPVLCDDGQPSSRFVRDSGHGYVMPFDAGDDALRAGFLHCIARAGLAHRRQAAARVRDIFGWPAVTRQLLTWIAADVAAADARARRQSQLQRLEAEHRARLLPFRNRHRGERCFVVGCAPSLGKMDLSRLAGERIFSVNRGYLSASFGLPVSTYYVVGDPQTYQAYWSEIRTAGVGQRFYKANVYDLPEYSAAAESDREDAIRVPFFESPTMDLGHFATEASDGIFRGFTVVLDAVQLAYFMGFQEVYIIGCDLDYQGSQTHVYGTGAYELRRRNDMPIARVLEAMKVAANAFDRDGRLLANAGVGGNLDTIPRLPFDSLFTHSTPSDGASLSADLAEPHLPILS